MLASGDGVFACFRCQMYQLLLSLENLDPLFATRWLAVCLVHDGVVEVCPSPLPQPCGPGWASVDLWYKKKEMFIKHLFFLTLDFCASWTGEKCT